MIYRLFVLILILIITTSKLYSQFEGKILVETGENYASSGIYGNVYGEIAYLSNDFKISTISGININRNLFNALKINVSRDFIIKDKKFNGLLFYQWRPFSKRLHEQNLGLLFQFDLKRFEFDLGFNSRIYNLPYNYTRLNNYDKTIIWEAFNLMYKITYNQPINERLKANISVTNFDLLMIQQETNPFIITNIDYQLSSNTNIFTDLGYLQAGLFNMRVNYFGFFIRGGVQWKF
ncbi:MAG: hypothetical protein BGO29_01870 [Bacteroidales bacterium 36-12]|nr:MAG: hypothetical protein BGO29_01870 [Bacteroidales bacterium 36-12]